MCVLSSINGANTVLGPLTTVAASNAPPKAVGEEGRDPLEKQLFPHTKSNERNTRNEKQ
jgi:hypothetical protein